MASLSIHGLDEEVAALLKARARAEKTSLNVLVKRLLAEALGVKSAGGKHLKDFERFCGGWTKEQAAAFGKAVRSMEQVDRGDWE
jgi:hypothetical protein